MNRKDERKKERKKRKDRKGKDRLDGCLNRAILIYVVITAIALPFLFYTPAHLGLSQSGTSYRISSNPSYPSPSKNKKKERRHTLQAHSYPLPSSLPPFPSLYTIQLIPNYHTHTYIHAKTSKTYPYLDISAAGRGLEDRMR